MIDPINLLFCIMAMQFSIKLTGADEISAEGFLNNDSMLADDTVETRFIELSYDVDELIRWDS